MKSPSDVAFSALQRTALHTASLLVPAAERQDWRCEWLSELWHVRSSYLRLDDTLSLQSQSEITWFCLGAFSDALCVRELATASGHPRSHMHGSAAQPLLWLAAILLLCFLITSLLPGVRAEREAAQFLVNPNALIISEAADHSWKPSIPAGLYLNWKYTHQRFFQDLAFYHVSRETAHAGSARILWNVARSSLNLFSLLGVPLKQAFDDNSGLPSVVLSNETWIRSFAGDPSVTGKVVRIGNSNARIAGVAPAAAWQLPGAPDVWLLQSDTQIATDLPYKTRGFLVAQLSERGLDAMQQSGDSISAHNLEDMLIDLSATPISAPVEGPWNLYGFALFLALVALPAVSSVSLGETQMTNHRISSREGLRRFCFLGGKFILVAGIGLFASFDIAYCYTASFSPAAECLQLVSCFAICLFGFRWALADQRHRCPVCLRRVTNPASVGLASRTFLGWNGTEMICMGGHTLLHVPALPTSWFSDQRWLYLDSSWQFLFADPGIY
ncbi:ABC transporter permease [Occallatibacter savannae]|uniref:ABC transporter permease n=1 Tax=Occallatibacter savannae TaxID=1002691 RepID=UPI000D69221E|nr:hypothetical protein [Occallatibacter savannae]